MSKFRNEHRNLNLNKNVNFYQLFTCVYIMIMCSFFCSVESLTILNNGFNTSSNNILVGFSFSKNHLVGLIN
jgi:hypothetical protein